MSDLPLDVITEEMMMQAALNADVTLTHNPSHPYNGWKKSPACHLALMLNVLLLERFVSMFELAGALAATKKEQDNDIDRSA